MEHTKGPGRCSGCKRSLASELTWIGVKSGDKRRCIDDAHVSYFIDTLTTDRDKWKAMAVELGESLTNILDQTDGPESMVPPKVTTWNYANEALAKLKEMES